ncbi:MAG: hypothetical protein ACM3SW_09110 [Actinomycetota bacterium]
MKPDLIRFVRMLAWVAAVLLAGAVVGCKSSPPENQTPVSNAPSQSAASSSSAKSDDPRINLECAADKIQKPPFAFHWSLKKNVSDSGPSDREADVTPALITGIATDSSSTRTIHAAPADESAWSAAVLDLAGPLPASTVALVNNSSAMTRDGKEKVNGEDTIKYSIDTARDTPEDANLIKNVLGEGGFIKGTFWVTGEGCPVKFVMDVEQHLKNGTVVKEHYDQAMTRK